MRFLQYTLLGLLLCTSVMAQTKGVIKTISTNALTESVAVPSGQTLTIKPGASIIAEAGSIVTGFGSGGTWGSITGTLSNQTDLQSALDAKLSTMTAAATYAPLAGPTFTGVVTIPSGASIAGYLTTSAASSTYLTIVNAAATYAPISHTHTIANVTGLQTALDAKAPLASPTFTGVVTIPSGASIAGYLTTATAASTYLPLTGGTVTGVTTFSNATSSTSSSTGAVVLSAGGLGVAGAVQVAGNVVSAGNVFAGAGNTIGFSSRTRLSSGADGRLALTNVSAATTELQMGGTSTSFPEFITRTTNGITLQSAASSATFNDATSSTGTVALRYLLGLPTATLTSNNTGITVTDAAALYIAGAPVGGLNTTVTNGRALLVAGGTSYFGGPLLARAAASTTAARVGGNVYANTTSVMQTSLDVEDTLHSFPLGANAAQVDGDRLVILADMQMAVSGYTGTWKLMAGSELVSFSGDSSEIGRVRVTLTRTSGSTADVMVEYLVMPGASSPPETQVTSGFSFDWGSPPLIYTSGISSVADTVVSRSLLVDFLPAR